MVSVLRWCNIASGLFAVQASVLLAVCKMCAECSVEVWAERAMCTVSTVWTVCADCSVEVCGESGQSGGRRNAGRSLPPTMLSAHSAHCEGHSVLFWTGLRIALKKCPLSITMLHSHIDSDSTQHWTLARIGHWLAAAREDRMQCNNAAAAGGLRSACGRIK